MVDPVPILSERVSLVALPPELLATIRGNVVVDRPFEWPQWWPDEADPRTWPSGTTEQRGRARRTCCGDHAVVDRHSRMLGHAGFHLPPRSLEAALDDPSFVGTRDPVSGGVVEVGYTIFPDHRHQGYATEAVTALVDWAQTTTEVRAVLAAVDQHNAASVRVLESVGGFVRIGTCRAGDGTVEDVFRARPLKVSVLAADELDQLHAVVGGDHLGGLLADHDRRRVGVAADDVRHDAGVRDAQVARPRSRAAGDRRRLPIRHVDVRW